MTAALKIFDTNTLRKILSEIDNKVQSEIGQIKTKIKQHELEIYNKWKLLYKKCNPVDYLINSSYTSRRAKCLKDCYDNIDMFSTFISNYTRTLNDMLNMYDSFVTRVKTSAEHVDSIALRVKFIESEIIDVFSEFKIYVTSFGKHGVLYVTPLRFYKLHEFIYIFTGEQLKLPTVDLDKTLEDLAIYLTTNKIEPVNNAKALICDTRVCSYTTTDDTQRDITASPITSVDAFGGDNVATINLGDITDIQFEAMSVANDDWFEDELKTNEEPAVVATVSAPDDTIAANTTTTTTTITNPTTENVNTHDLFYRLYDNEEINEILLTHPEVIAYSKIIYEKLLTPDDYNIIDDAEIKNYVTMIRKYLRDLYHEADMRDDARGLQVTLPEYLRKVFRPVSVCGNGSCFYSALSTQMLGNASLASVLRVIIVYHMKINKWWILNNFYIDLSGDTTFNDLVRKSLLSHEYVDGGFTPVMMSIILDKPINIYGHTKNTFIRINSWVFQSLKTHRANQLSEFYLYLHENHYTALELLQNDTSNIPHLDDYKADVFSTFVLI